MGDAASDMHAAGTQAGGARSGEAHADGAHADGAPPLPDEQRSALALRVFGEARVSLMMAFRFLDRALWKMPPVPVQAPWLLASDGRELRIGVSRTLTEFRANPDAVTRALLHTLLHCIFRHPARTVRRDPGTWSLACDICIEAIAVELCGGAFALEGDERIERTARAFENAGVPLVPARVYRALLGWQREPGGDPLLDALARDPQGAALLFARDSHELWDLSSPPPPAEDGDSPQENEGGRPDDGENEAGEGAPPDQETEPADDSSDETGEGSDGGGDADDAVPDGEDGGRAGTGEGEEDAGGEVPQRQPDDEHGSRPDARESADGDDGADGGGNAPDPADADAQQFAGTPGDSSGPGGGAEYEEGELPAAQAPADAGDNEWEAIAQQVETMLETLEQQRGEGAGRMMGNLELANRSRIDYADFLRRFATRAEDMQVNDEEFDYLFYTYGLSRYGNMPLVEPLEYKDAERVREFVIAIDTSGSCSHGLVRSFLTRTYEILSQAGARGQAVNIHIVQCDAEVQSDAIVTSMDELREYERGFEVRGMGGTDFRPVFAYVDELVERREFEDLRGLVYFTDGYGVFPSHAPAYDVAFVFVEEEGKQRRVPPWAMKVIMDGETLEELEE